jgi:hypothetical protein
VLKKKATKTEWRMKRRFKEDLKEAMNTVAT